MIPGFSSKLSFLVAFLTVVILAEMLVFSPVAASQNVSVYVKSVSKGRWAKIDGVTGWVGSVNIDVTEASGTHPYESYCIEYDQYVYLGGTYTGTAQSANDLSKWRSVSYILTWYHPTSDNNEAFAIQAAVWKFATSRDPTGEANDPTKRAYQIYNDALDKDVMRESDTLTLTPENAAVPVNTPQILIAKIVDSSSSPRKGVRILFSTDLGALNRTWGITNEKGEVAVEIVSAAEGIAQVKAETKAYWAQILNLGVFQDLIGVGYPTVTAKADIAFIRFFVVPEVPLGTATATTLGLLAVVVKTRCRRM